jgi:hypothetical protein
MTGKSIPKIVYDAGAGDVEIQFDYPPLGLDYEGRTFKFINKITQSSNGNYQNSENFVEEERNLTFKQVKQSILNQVETFMITFAGSKRKTFKYFVDSNEVDFITLQVSKSQGNWRPKRTGWNTNNEYTYEFKLKIRRVL